MTETSDIDAPQKIGADKILLGLLVVVVLGAFFFMSSQRQEALRSSPTGLDGLQIWLTRSGQETQSFTGGWPLDAEGIGLQIIPLYDTQLDVRRESPQSQEELLFQQDEYDLRTEIIIEKAAEVPSMIVLPKWRSGMRLTGLAHPALLAEQDRIGQVASQFISGPRVKQNPIDRPFSRFGAPQDPDQTVMAYAAQTLNAPQCTALIGSANAMVLGLCPLHSGGAEQDIYVLADPDLISNHGLLLADNAYAMRDWLTQVSGDGRVLIDYSRENWLTQDVTQSTRDRTWADLMRFFEPPFTVIWAALVLTIALTLWRAAVRFGPLLQGPAAIGSAKGLSIAARARLMRLSGHDGALAAEYGKARLAATAAALFGPSHARQFSRAEDFLAYTKRRHPQHAPALTQALNAISALPDAAMPAHAMAAIADLDRILETIRHDT